MDTATDTDTGDTGVSEYGYVSLIGDGGFTVTSGQRDVDFGELMVGTAQNSWYSLDRVRLQLTIGPGNEPFNGFYLATDNVSVAADYVQNCRLRWSQSPTEFARGVAPSRNTGAITWDVMTDDLVATGGQDPFSFRVVCDISDAPMPPNPTAFAIVLLQPEEFGMYLGDGTDLVPVVYANNGYPNPTTAAILVD